MVTCNKKLNALLACIPEGDLETLNEVDRAYFAVRRIKKKFHPLTVYHSNFSNELRVNWHQLPMKFWDTGDD